MDENKIPGRIYNSKKNEHIMDIGKDILDIAFRNSYAVVMEQELPTDLISLNEGYFIHHPNKRITKEQLKNMIDYFADIEEFEKCVKLKIKFGNFYE